MYCGKKTELLEQNATGTYYVVFADAEDEGGEADLIYDLSFLGDAYDNEEEAGDVVVSAFEEDSELMEYIKNNPWCKHVYAYVEKTVLEDGYDVTPSDEDGYFYINDYFVDEE